MKDLYLRFESGDEATRQLIDFGFYNDEEGGGLHHPDISLDLVGVIIHSSGEEGSKEITVEDGYHVNLRVMDDDLDLSPLDKFIISPKTPIRVWA